MLNPNEEYALANLLICTGKIVNEQKYSLEDIKPEILLSRKHIKDTFTIKTRERAMQLEHVFSKDLLPPKPGIYQHGHTYPTPNFKPLVLIKGQPDLQAFNLDPNMALDKVRKSTGKNLSWDQIGFEYPTTWARGSNIIENVIRIQHAALESLVGDRDVRQFSDRGRWLRNIESYFRPTEVDYNDGSKVITYQPPVYEEIEERVIDLVQQALDFIGDDQWCIYKTVPVFEGVRIDRYVDYRIYDWHRQRKDAIYEVEQRLD
jgi:hypothetical protein